MIPERLEALMAQPVDAVPSITIRVVCSKGTYIRALARDIGEALGSGAYLTALQRTRVGDYTLDRCLRIEDFEQWADDNILKSIDT